MTAGITFAFVTWSVLFSGSACFFKDQKIKVISDESPSSKDTFNGNCDNYCSEFRLYDNSRIDVHAATHDQ